jgi:predicted RNA polymerase sigma factor
VTGPAAALAIVDGITGLDDSYLLPSVRGELLMRLGRNAEAAGEFDRAAAANENDLERTVLEDKAVRAREKMP